jgi:glycosyltransferase involved in cell wall biosynthesis
MTKVTTINLSYSTTRTVTRQQSVIEKNPDDQFETMLFFPEVEGRQGNSGLRSQGYFKNSLPGQSLITVVTVVFNGEQFLEETILSVIDQAYDNVEYILIDGGSTDGTLDIIRKYEYAIDYWVSEADQGIYDAMNKGITLSSGDWINFMNAGDQFISSDVLQEINFKVRPKESVLVGDVEYDSGKIFTSLQFSLYLKNSIHHQAAFYPLILFKKLGLYNTDYKILADYDFNLKSMVSNVQFENLNKTIALCSDFGISDTPKLSNYQEEIRVRKHYVDSKFKRVLFGCYSWIRFMGKRVIRWA